MRQIFNPFEASSVFCSRADFRVCAIAALAFLALAVPSGTRADEEPPKDPYKLVWEEVSEYLRRREYGSALACLEAGTDEQDLRAFAKQIESDKAAIAGLQDLERIVHEQAEKLAPGTPMAVSGIEFTVAGFDKNPQGNALILKSKSIGKETRKPIAELPSVIWLELSRAHLKELKSSSMTLGIFLGFDKTADWKASRKLLNEAAGNGDPVTPWLARLDAAEEAKKLAAADGDATPKNDPVVGHWNLKLANDLSVNIEFRDNGTVVLAFPLQTLREMRRRKLPPPVNNPNRGKWTKLDTGEYRLTMTGGFTTEFTIIGDRLLGRPPREGGKGRTTGIRQVK